MKYHKFAALFVFQLAGLAMLHCQPDKRLIDPNDLTFLEGLTKDVMESARIYPNQFISNEIGSNNSGGTLIRPGGREAYPSFWIRDYALSLGTGFVTAAEQKHMLLLTASMQCDQAWITEGGSMVQYGPIAVHIRIDDGKPIYFPGTYNYEAQGVPRFGLLPPYGDHFPFIDLAYQYVRSTSDRHIYERRSTDGQLWIDY